MIRGTIEQARHTIQRAHERYGLRLDQADYERISAMADAAYSAERVNSANLFAKGVTAMRLAVEGRGGRTRNLIALKYNRRWLLAVYDPDSRGVVTVLPPARFRDFGVRDRGGRLRKLTRPTT